jgi:UDP-glucose-4-epimerase GalE
MTGTRWIVTGGAGYIGSHIVKAIMERNEPVLILDNLSTGHAERMSFGTESEIFDLAKSEPADLLNKWKPTSLVHAAGIKYAGESLQNPIKFYKNNVNSTINLLEACKNSSVQKITFSSSCSVYGEQNRFPVQETSDTMPISPYGMSKLMAENILKDFANTSKIYLCNLRYFNVAGNSEGLEDSSPFNLFPILANAVKHNLPFTIYGNNYSTPDGTAIRDYVDVRDIAKAHLKINDALGRVSIPRALNVGQGKGTSVGEIVGKFVEFSPNWTQKVNYGPRRIGDPEVIYGNNDLLLKTVAWVPESNLESMVRSVLRQ